MAQGGDGSWYAYIADNTYVGVADPAAAGNIEFGALITQTATTKIGSVDLASDAVSIAGAAHQTEFTTAQFLSEGVKGVAGAAAGTVEVDGIISAGAGFVAGTISFTGATSGVGTCTVTTAQAADGTLTELEIDAMVCTVTAATTDNEITTFVQDIAPAETQNVLNGTILLNADTTLASQDASNVGQIGIDPSSWPFVQTYNFNPTGDVVIEYKKAGVNETTTLTYDTTSDVVVIDADRTEVPQGAAVHIGIGDPQLNIDPTSEDVWYFDVTAGTTLGQAYYRETVTGNDEVLTADLMFEDNGALKITANNVLAVSDNADLTLATAAIVGLYETGANTSYFTTYDDSDNSVVDVAAAAPRGTAGTIDYNDSPTSFVVTHEFATLTLDSTSVGDEWNSGEGIDSDFN